MIMKNQIFTKKVFGTIFASLFLLPIISLAQNGTTTTSTTTSPVATTTTQVACIHAALEKRENALINGHDSFNTAIKSALTKRLADLKDAWIQTDKKARQGKRQVTHKAFRLDTQTAHNNMRTLRISAWRAFDTDMKSCGVRGHGETPQLISTPTSSL